MNQEDWIYVVPFTDCSWSELTRSVHEAFHRLAVERGWDKDYTGIYAKNIERRRMALARNKGKTVVRTYTRRRGGKKAEELLMARITATNLLKQIGTATVKELCEKAGTFSETSWRQWCVLAVKTGVAVYHPGRRAKEDRYEWKGHNETNTNSGPVG